jgi:NAD-dependent deacetylase
MELLEALSGARRIAFFTGAGASTEAPTSLPDFRSASGLWNNRTLMEALTRGTFFADPAAFWAMFREIFLPWRTAEPNEAHRAPARVARLGKEVAVVTQNIDGLDQRCASGYPVFEIHGHLRTMTCPSCGSRASTDGVPALGPPRCPCGAIFKPDVVLFDDPIDWDGVFLPARDWIATADLLVVVGTSLTVGPANQLALDRPAHCPMILINRDPTPFDEKAALALHKPAGALLSRALDALEGKPGAAQALASWLAE